MSYIGDAEQPAVQSVLLRLRKEKGLTQKKLMAALGVSYNTIAFAERGTVLTKKTAEKLSAFFGVTVMPVVSARRKVTAEKRLARRQEKVAAAEAKANGTVIESATEAVATATEAVTALAEEIKDGNATPAANEPNQPSGNPEGLPSVD